MIAFGHSSIGAIIGVVATVTLAPSTPLWLKVLLVFIVAVASHYATDAIPHGHYVANIKKATPAERLIFGLDTLGAFGLLVLITYAVTAVSLALLLVVVGMVGALLPDIWEGLLELKLIPRTTFAKKHRHFHYYTVHWHRYSGPQLAGRRVRAWSITDIWQVLVGITAVLLILTLPPT